MRLLDRYLTGIYLRNLCVSIFSMTLFFLFQSMFTDLYDHSYPTNQIFFYHLLSIPKIFVEMSPPSVMLATVLTLSGLARTNELIAYFAAGVGLRRLLTTLLGIILIFSGLILAMQDHILPPFFKKRTNYYYQEMQKKQDFFLDIKRDKIWYRSKNMIYNLQRFDSKANEIHGMSVYTFDEDFNLVQVVNAEKAEFSPNHWKLKYGSVTLFLKDDPFPLTKNFTEKEMTIAETPRDFQEIEKEVDGLRIKELFYYVQRMKSAGADTKAYEVKLHSRFSTSFIPIVMCLLAVPFSVGNRREGGLAKDLGICLGITFVYWIFYSVGLSLGTNGALPPFVAAWLPSTLFAGAGILLSARKFSQ